MKIEPIFIIFALWLVLLLFFKESKSKAFIIYLSFVVIFVMSRCGADYDTYELHYNTDCSTMNIELFYKTISNFFHGIGLPYEQFRLIYLSVCLALLCYSLYNMTKRFTLAFLILYLGYLQYLLAAYRQFAAMAIAFWCFYQLFYKRRAILPLLASWAATQFHKSAYIVFAWCVVWAIVRIVVFIIEKKSNRKITYDKFFASLQKAIRKSWIFLLLVCLFARFAMYYITNIPFIYRICEKIVSSNYMGKSLISIGLLSRTVILFLFLWMYPRAERNEKYNPIVLFYLLCMVGYMVLPFETFSGRLFNFGRIFEVILIPYLFDALYPYEKTEKQFVSVNQGGVYISSSKMFLWIVIIVYCFIFVRQLTIQKGYSPYVNVYFDAIISFFKGLL